MSRSLKTTKEFNNKQKQLISQLKSSEALQRAEDYQWDAGTGWEDPLSHRVQVTPSFVARVLFEVLEDEDMVITSGGCHDSEDVIWKRMKNSVFKGATEYLEESNKVLMPDGSRVDRDKVKVLD